MLGYYKAIFLFCATPVTQAPRRGESAFWDTWLFASSTARGESPALAAAISFAPGSGCTSLSPSCFAQNPHAAPWFHKWGN